MAREGKHELEHGPKEAYQPTKPDTRSVKKVAVEYLVPREVDLYGGKVRGFTGSCKGGSGGYCRS